MAEKKKEAEKKEFKTFYPSLPGKDTIIHVGGKRVTVKPEGYKTSTAAEEAEFQALADDPQWHVTAENPNAHPMKERLAFHKGEVERLEKEIG